MRGILGVEGLNKKLGNSSELHRRAVNNSQALMLGAWLLDIGEEKKTKKKKGKSSRGSSLFNGHIRDVLFS